MRHRPLPGLIIEMKGVAYTIGLNREARLDEYDIPILLIKSIDIYITYIIFTTKSAKIGIYENICLTCSFNGLWSSYLC